MSDLVEGIGALVVLIGGALVGVAALGLVGSAAVRAFEIGWVL